MTNRGEAISSISLLLKKLTATTVAIEDDVTVIADGAMLTILSQRADILIHSNGGVLTSILTSAKARLVLQ